MRMLFCWSAAEMSTFDVANGIHQALPVELVDYKLFNRIKLNTIAAREITPDNKHLDMDNICLLASEGIVYKAVISDCDWVFIVSGMALHPNALYALKKLNKKIAIWFTEAPYSTNKEQELYLDQFCDVSFTNERTAVNLFKNATYLPHSFNTKIHLPVRQEPELDVVFIGSGFEDRQRLLESVNFENINFVLGGLWPGINEPHVLLKYLKFPDAINNSLTTELYQKTKIGLNIHRYFPGAESCNPRIFELAATKTFIISDYRKELEEIFGDSIVTFEPGDHVDLEYKIKYYLSHPEERAEKIEQAYLKVQEYTFNNRAKDIINVLENFDQKERSI